ncbi:MAG: hypothetical protein AB7O26_05680 [Planctomycetaceae bacterium]
MARSVMFAHFLVEIAYNGLDGNRPNFASEARLVTFHTFDMYDNSRRNRRTSVECFPTGKREFVVENVGQTTISTRRKRAARTRVGEMWAKICGIRDVATASAVAKLRPDAIGLNFYAPSVRSIDVETAAEIVRTLPANVEPIGLFVNHSMDEVLSIVKQTGIKAAQMHGDESPEFLAELSRRIPEVSLIRAHRMGADGLASLAEYLRDCATLGAPLRAVIVDAHVAGQFGGTGQLVPWDQLRKEYQRSEWPPLILAGGLVPENICEAIRATEPWGVDVAGGVESSPGTKDIAKVKRFLTEARAAGV